MGEWKAPLSLRVRQRLHHELEDAAARERRTLGNFGELLVELAFERHKEAGSTEKLLRLGLGNHPRAATSKRLGLNPRI